MSEDQAVNAEVRRGERSKADLQRALALVSQDLAVAQTRLFALAELNDALRAEPLFAYLKRRLRSRR